MKMNIPLWDEMNNGCKVRYDCLGYTFILSPAWVFSDLYIKYVHMPIFYSLIVIGVLLDIWPSHHH